MQDEVKANSSVPKLALTRTEAAEALGVRPITIDRLAKRGLLRPSRATRRPLYSVAEIERFLKETMASCLLRPRRSRHSFRRSRIRGSRALREFLQ